MEFLGEGGLSPPAPTLDPPLEGKDVRERPKDQTIYTYVIGLSLCSSLYCGGRLANARISLTVDEAFTLSSGSQDRSINLARRAAG